MQVLYEKQPIKALAKMPVKIASHMRAKIAAFAAGATAPNLDIETLKGVEKGFRLRQDDWRALMLVKDGMLRVTLIKPRGDVYK